MRNTRWTILGLAVAGVLILTACRGSATPTSGAAKAVEDYLQALVARDVNTMIDLACLNWEQQARLDYNAFNAVKLEMKDLSCQESGKEGDFTLVTCSGAIVANYGAEDMSIDVAERSYQAIEENGQWRMCGYH